MHSGFPTVHARPLHSAVAAFGVYTPALCELSPFDRSLAPAARPPAAPTTAGGAARGVEAWDDSDGGGAAFGITTAHGERWYYEVTLDSGKLGQIGWIDARRYAPQISMLEGVGDCAHSWAVDLKRMLVWHETECAYSTRANRWSTGDIIGCALDLRDPQTTRGGAGLTMSFSLNGKALGVASAALFKPSHIEEVLGR